LIELRLVGVRVELESSQPIVLLKERDGERYLPILIGSYEAMAIAFAMQGVVTPRPLTHDLIKLLLDEMGYQLDYVYINEFSDSTYFSMIHLSGGGSSYDVSSRPSDAIAIAARTGSPIYAAEEVLDELSVSIRDDEEENEVEKFREFLEQVTPEDFRA